MLALSAPAMSADPDTKKIEQIERQIEELRQQVQELTQRVTPPAPAAEVKSAAKPPRPDEPKVAEKPTSEIPRAEGALAAMPVR